MSDSYLDTDSQREQQPPEYDFCAYCREHAVFEQDEDTGEWLSTCCGARPMPVDVEFDDFDFNDRG